MMMTGLPPRPNRSRRLATVASHLTTSRQPAAAAAEILSSKLLLVEPPAAIGDSEADVETPALIVDLVCLAPPAEHILS